MQALIYIAKAISSLEKIISEMDEQIRRNEEVLGIENSDREEK